MYLWLAKYWVSETIFPWERIPVAGGEVDLGCEKKIWVPKMLSSGIGKRYSISNSVENISPNFEIMVFIEAEKN